MKINKLSNTDAAYIAGFLDGEGTITIYRNSYRSADGTPTYALLVSIWNTFQGVIDWIALTVGYGNVHFKRRSSVKGYKPIYEWKVNGEVAIELLRQLQPYLKVKRLQAEIAFQFGDTLSGPGRKLPGNVAEFRKRLRKQVSILNH